MGPWVHGSMGPWGGGIARTSGRPVRMVKHADDPRPSGLVRVPFFTGLVIVTLALGIAANTAIFSVIQAVLLKPLPLSRPRAAGQRGPPGAGREPRARRLGGVLLFHVPGRREELPGRRDVARRHLQRDGRRGTWKSYAAWTSPMASSRCWACSRPSGGCSTGKTTRRTARRRRCLSYQYWQTRFGGDQKIVGRRIILDGRPREIIGVLPQSFRFLDQRPSVVVPARLNRKDTHLGQFNFAGIARLKPGVALERANADLSRLIPVAPRGSRRSPGTTRRCSRPRSSHPCCSRWRDRDRRHQRRALGADGHRRAGAADRVRERRQPACW